MSIALALGLVASARMASISTSSSPSMTDVSNRLATCTNDDGGVAGLGSDFKSAADCGRAFEGFDTLDGGKGLQIGMAERHGEASTKGSEAGRSVLGSTESAEDLPELVMDSLADFGFSA